MAQPHERKSLNLARHSLTPAQLRRIRDARADGSSWADLSARFGLAEKTLRRAVEGVSHA